MCLWFVQECIICESFTPIPTALPEVCDSVSCKRRFLDPKALTLAERYQYLDKDFPCSPECSFETCGLIIRHRLCGAVGALRVHCREHYSSDSDSNNSENSETRCDNEITCH